MIEIVNMETSLNARNYWHSKILNKKYTEKRWEENKPEFLTLVVFE